MAIAEPLKFESRQIAKVWGGDGLSAVLGRESHSQSIGESWDLVDRPDFSSQICTGAWKGHSLHDLLQAQPLALLGVEKAPAFFPLLFKFINAETRLSLQVHPDARMAERHGTEAKNECWYFLQVDENAFASLGLKETMSPDAFQKSLNTGQIESCLQMHTINTGDFVSVPGGTLHCIGGGMVLAEIQQNSDTTYRLHDWNRTDGESERTLHIEDALEAMCYGPSQDAVLSTKEQSDDCMTLLENDYFHVHKLLCKKTIPFEQDTKCSILQVVLGSGCLKWSSGKLDIHLGDTLLIPSDLHTWNLQTDTTMEMLQTIPITGKAQ